MQMNGMNGMHGMNGMNKENEYSVQSIESMCSFTPKRPKKTPYPISHEVQHLIAQSMTPFKSPKQIAGRLNFDQVEDQSATLDLVVTQLEANEIMTADVRQICLHALSNRNLICSHSMNTIQRSLLFSLLPLLVKDGLIVVVSTFYILLKEKLRRIRETVNWAAINPEVAKCQVEYIMDNLSSKNVQMLIIHPDMLQQVSLAGLQIQLLLLDQVDVSIDIQAVCTHILTTHLQEARLIEMKDSKPYNKEYSTYRQEITQISMQITSTRDSQPVKQLMQLFRSSRLFRKKGILVFCSSNSEVESVSHSLTANGFKCGGVHGLKSEVFRQNLYYEFAAGSIDALLLPSGFILPEGLKNFAYLSIHVSVPQDIETFLLDVSELHKEANSHLFISDAQYFNQRAELCSKFIQIESVERVLQNVYAGEALHEDENDLKYWLSRQWLHTEQPSNDYKIKKILLQQSMTILNINKKTMYFILEELQRIGWVELQIVMPIEVFIGSDQIIDEICPNASIFGRKQTYHSRNGLKCSMDDLIKGTTMTPLQYIQLLRSKKLVVDVVEEAQLLKMIHIPSHSELMAKVIDIYSALKRKNIILINNLDMSYTMGRVGSFHSLEYMWKQLQLKPDNKCASFILKYLSESQFIDAKECAESENIQFPFSRLETQRDKSTLLQDLKIVFHKMKVVFDDITHSWIERENFATKALYILQGLKPDVMKEWKSSPVWNKYRSYNYLQIHAAVHELIDLLDEKHQQYCQLRKKVKL